MTHSVSQWKIRLLSLMVAASVFTGGMATLAEPADAKKKSSHSKKKKKKSKSNNGNFEGAQATVEVDKEIDQSAEQENNSNQQCGTPPPDSGTPPLPALGFTLPPLPGQSEPYYFGTTGGGGNGGGCSGTNTPMNDQSNTNMPTASQNDLGSNNAGAASMDDD